MSDIGFIRRLQFGLGLLAMLLIASLGNATEMLSAGADQMPDTDDQRASSVSLSASGRFVAFTTNATTLVPGDNNVDGNGIGIDDVYVLDRTTGEYDWVSEPQQSGVIADGPSEAGVISGDGQWVAFISGANNLVPGDDNLGEDAFLKNLLTGNLIRISDFLNTEDGNPYVEEITISADGSTVAFSVNAGVLPNPVAGVYLYDVTPGTISLGSQNRRVDGRSNSAISPTLSADGRRLGFISNFDYFLDSVDIPADIRQAYLLDRDADTLSLVSQSLDATPADERCFQARISGNGRFMAVSCHANFGLLPDGGVTDDNRNAVFRFDLDSGAIAVASIGADGSPVEEARQVPLPIAISDDGGLIVFDWRRFLSVNGDTSSSLYLRDIAAAHTIAVASPPQGGRTAGGLLPALTSDGGYIAYLSGDAAPDGVVINNEVFGREVDGTNLRVTGSIGAETGVVTVTNDGPGVATLTVVAVTDDSFIDIDVQNAPEISRCIDFDSLDTNLPEPASGCVLPNLAQGESIDVPFAVNEFINDPATVYVLANEISASGQVLTLDFAPAPPPPAPTPDPPPSSGGGGGGGAIGLATIGVFWLLCVTRWFLSSCLRKGDRSIHS